MTLQRFKQAAGAETGAAAVSSDYRMPGLPGSPESALIPPASPDSEAAERQAAQCFMPPRPEPVIEDKYARLWTQRQLDAYGSACYDAGFLAGQNSRREPM